MLKAFRILIVSMSIVIPDEAISQEIPDISGEWKGMASVSMANDIEIRYSFVQDDSLITGFGINKSLNGRDSSKYLIEGSISGNEIIFTGIKFEYKVGPGCLSKVTFRFPPSNSDKLIGRWSGDWSIKTCPPGSGGELVVFRNQPVVEDEPDISNTTVVNNELGEALVSELKNRKYYALIIGINDYSDSEIQDLGNPLSDAKSLRDVLVNSYNFLPENTTLLQNPTRDQIIDQFDELSDKLTSRDQLLIFYAGHGIWDKRIKQGYWLPSDASKSSKSRWLSNSTIRDYVGGIRSKHTLLISDACFSGGIFRERGLSMENSNALLQLYNLTSRKAITSGTLTTVPDESVFIEYLIKQLKQNSSKLLSAEELYRSFRIAVINNSVNGQVPQYGAIGQVGDEGGDFIFLKTD